MNFFEARNINICSFLMISFLLFYSCGNQNNNTETLLKSIELSNDIYTERVSQLREYFESKFDKEPLIYEESYNKIRVIEYDIAKFSELTTTKEKKEFITDVLLKNESISQLVSIEFVCLNINENNIDLFNSVAKNDLYRNLYLIYKEFYYYQHAVY